MWNSNIFLGLSASYSEADTDFKIAPGNSNEFGLSNFSFSDAGLALSLVYDSRDNTMMPARGQQISFESWRYDESIGGDFDYTKTSLAINSFHPFGEDWVVGWRLDFATAQGNIPFYAEPYVSLRGIPALRYQGKTVGAVEIETRYRFSPRWSALVFAGSGFAEARAPSRDTEDSIFSTGVGIRFLALEEQDAWVGLDIANGPEDIAWYIQIGQTW